jgi:DNA-binding XRE family transcriptional regulator
MTETTKTKLRKQRKDVKLTADKLATIERCLKLRMKQEEICEITQINRATIAAVKLVLVHQGRL